MLVSSRHFPIGNACNNNFKLWRQELFCTKDKINEDQIKAMMSGHGSHAILVLPILSEVPN